MVTININNHIFCLSKLLCPYIHLILPKISYDMKVYYSINTFYDKINNNHCLSKWSCDKDFLLFLICLCLSIYIYICFLLIFLVSMKINYELFYNKFSYPYYHKILIHSKNNTMVEAINKLLSRYVDSRYH